MTTQKSQLSELWSRVCLGEQKAYASLHYQLYPHLFIYARNFVKDEDVANDVVQDLFVKLWVKKASIGSIENVKAYFYRAIRSLAINYLRSLKARESKLDAMVVDELQFSIEDSMIAEENELSLKQNIQAALNKLPAKQREIIYLSFFESLNYNQIVEITGIKYQSVVNHVYRAVQVLRNEVKLGNKVAA